VFWSKLLMVINQIINYQSSPILSIMKKNLFLMYLVCREHISLTKKNLRLNQNPLGYSNNNLGSHLATMNESWVPKCLNLCKTCQDISLSIQ
jgi:hypothetical protein